MYSDEEKELLQKAVYALKSEKLVKGAGFLFTWMVIEKIRTGLSINDKELISSVQDGLEIDAYDLSRMLKSLRKNNYI